MSDIKRTLKCWQNRIEMWLPYPIWSWLVRRRYRGRRITRLVDNFGISHTEIPEAMERLQAEHPEWSKEAAMMQATIDIASEGSEASRD